MYAKSAGRDASLPECDPWFQHYCALFPWTIDVRTAGGRGNGSSRQESGTTHEVLDCFSSSSWSGYSICSCALFFYALNLLEEFISPVPAQRSLARHSRFLQQHLDPHESFFETIHNRLLFVIVLAVNRSRARLLLQAQETHATN
jgi:hypothetical protein